MKFGKLIFTRKSHFSDIAACTGFAADAFAEIIRNDIVEARSFFLLPAGGAVFQVNPVEYFNQLKDADFDPRFFQQFASDPLFQSLSDLERATRNGPLSEQRLAAAADQQRPALIDDHAANAYYRPFGILP